MSEKKLYLIETVSMFRMRYVVEAESEFVAEQNFSTNTNNVDYQELSQKHIGESITSARKIKKKEYLELFNKDNEYLASWTDEEKFKFVNKTGDENA
jgi:hypothetical protein